MDVKSKGKNAVMVNLALESSNRGMKAKFFASSVCALTIGIAIGFQFRSWVDPQITLAKENIPAIPLSSVSRQERGSSLNLRNEVKAITRAPVSTSPEAIEPAIEDPNQEANANHVKPQIDGYKSEVIQRNKDIARWNKAVATGQYEGMTDEAFDILKNVSGDMYTAALMYSSAYFIQCNKKMDAKMLLDAIGGELSDSVLVRMNAVIVTESDKPVFERNAMDRLFESLHAIDCRYN